MSNFNFEQILFCNPGPECGADKKAFFDVLDPNDPRAIKYREEDEYFDYDIQKASGEKLDDAPPDKFTR